MTGSRRPIIGVSSYLERAVMDVWDVPAVFLPTSWATADIKAATACL